MSGTRGKRCLVCGRTDVRGFSRLIARRYRVGGGRAERLPAPDVWVCRRGYGCEGAGAVHLAFLGDPEARA
jgi:hypothetical protein